MNFIQIKINRLRTASNNYAGKSNFYLFLLILISTAFDRFSNEYLFSPIVYPKIFEVIIENNRLIFAILLGLFFANIYFGKNKKVKFKLSFYWAPIFLHLFLGIKLLVNGNSMSYISVLGAASLLVSMHACTFATRELHDFKNLVSFILSVVLSLVGLAAYQYVATGVDSMQVGSRFFFFTLHPNSAGIMWAFCVVTMLFLIIHDSSIYKFLKISLFLICMFFLFLTGSRGSYISCGFGIGMLLYLGTGRVQKNLKIYLFFILCLMVIYALFGNQLSGFYEFQAERGNTRADNYTDAFKSFLSSPIVGSSYFKGRPEFVENLLLSYMKSAGIFGLLLCISFYVGAIMILKISYLKMKISNEITPKYFIAIFFMMMVSSIFEASQINFVTFGSFVSMFAASYLIQYSRKRI